ncbi:MAG: putative transporter ATP-binding protein [Ilumatobacteraceae bacterium]|nr:putative transporter ATP-binding protein [Ilumatobacteraceae bacterium]
MSIDVEPRTDPSPVTPVVAAAMLHGRKIYGKGDTEVRALDDVSVEFQRGRMTAIMGPSGSGKSTLMHCLAGLDDLTSGEVWLGDVEFSTMNERQRTRIRRDRVGFVFQAYNLLPTLTAGENIKLPQLLAGRKPDQTTFDAVVARFGLANRLRHRPAELSGGQQQRVAVARALVAKPDVIFADEPTGNLDSHAGGEVLRLLREAVDELGQTVVMVTHDPSAAAIADRVLFLADGKVREEMTDPSVAKILDSMKALGG